MHQILESRKTREKQDKDSKAQYKDFGAGDNAVSINVKKRKRTTFINNKKY
jgi:hypothetical protein